MPAKSAKQDSKSGRSTKGIKTPVSKLLHEIVFNLHLTDLVKGKAPTTRKMKANTSTKGDRSAISSFLSCYDSEPKVAAYLGYRDLADFRKCQMSFHVIDYFNVYAKHCSGRNARVALELLRDIYNIESQLPQDLSEVIKTYTAPPTATAIDQQKLEVDTNLNYLMAALLYRLAETLKSSPSYTDAELAQRQAAAAKDFHEVMKRALPTGFDVANIIFRRRTKLRSNH